MNLNLYILRDYIEHPIAKSELHSNRLDRGITGISFYRAGQPIKDELVYIITKDDFENAGRSLPAAAYVCLGISTHPVPDSCDAIFLEDVSVPEDAYDLIGRVMSRFDNWEHTLYQMLLDGASLRDMGDCSLEYFENPISLYTNSHRNVFFCEKVREAKQRLFDENDVGIYLPQDDIDRMNADPEFIASIAATEPGLFTSNLWGYRILFYNIRFSEIYVARLMACETERPIRDSDYPLLEYLASFISIEVRNKDINLNDHPKDFDALARMLLDGSEPEPVQIQLALNSFGWSIADRFFCIVLDMTGHDQTIQAVSGLSARLESSLPACATIYSDGRILVIADIDAGNVPRDEIISQFESTMGGIHAQAGASCEFSDFRTLAAYVEQAQAAIRLGASSGGHPTEGKSAGAQKATDTSKPVRAQNAQDASKPVRAQNAQDASKPADTRSGHRACCWRYEDFMLADLIDSARGSRATEMLVPGGLRKLMDYDRAHGRNFTETLRVYLENDRSAARTTRALFIQRATFVYQLRRIKEITGFDLDNADTRLLLRIVFAAQR